MDFQQLKYFNSVALLGNMTKAAEVLCISQSALSKVINKIEDEVGCKLFDRNGKNITLNAAGNEFLEYSTKILKEYDECVSVVNQADGSNDRRVSIGIIGSCSEILRCAKGFAKLYPDTVFDIDGDVSTEETPNINNYDVLICPEGPKYDTVKGKTIFVDKYYIGVNKSHPLASKIGVSTRALDGIDMVIIKKDNDTESALWGVQSLGITPGKIHYVSNRMLHKQFISDGMAVGFLSDGSLKYYEDSKNIVVIPITDSRFSLKMKIAFKRGEKLNDIGKAFKAYAEDFFHLNDIE